MKRYIKPEIEALCFETLDVITTSGKDAVVEELTAYGIAADEVYEISNAFDDIRKNTWSW